MALLNKLKALFSGSKASSVGPQVLSQPTPQGSDGRTLFRYGFLHVPQLMTLQTEEGFQGQILDLSLGGAGVLFPGENLDNIPTITKATLLCSGIQMAQAELEQRFAAFGIIGFKFRDLKLAGDFGMKNVFDLLDVGLRLMNDKKPLPPGALTWNNTVQGPGGLFELKLEFPDDPNQGVLVLTFPSMGYRCELNYTNSRLVLQIRDLVTTATPPGDQNRLKTMVLSDALIVLAGLQEERLYSLIRRVVRTEPDLL